jgi:pimeloyl-ACP methyl ester carboxylesterase
MRPLPACLALLATAASFTLAAGNSSAAGIRIEDVPYPFPVETFAFDSQQQPLEMAYMDVKPDQPNGRAVVLLHGKNFNGAYWESTARQLSAAGYRVVIPDQIGFGKSSKPEHYQFTFQQLATNTAALLDKLAIGRVDVVGHSMGGMLATRFALMFPDRVERLALVDPIGLEDWKLVVPYHTIDQWYAQELKASAEKQRAYQMESYYHGTWRPEYDRWLNLSTAWYGDSQYPRVAWNSALTYDMIFTQPVCYEFANLKMPTLLVVGALDRTALGKQWVSEEERRKLGNYPKLAIRTAAQIPDCRLEILADIGHVPQIESPEKLFPLLLDFLAGKPE